MVRHGDAIRRPATPIRPCCASKVLNNSLANLFQGTGNRSATALTSGSEIRNFSVEAGAN